MKKADRFKLLYFISISLIIFLNGCIDTGVQVIPSSFDLRSQFKIVNLATDVGSASFTVLDAEGNSVATVSSLAFGDEYPGSGQDFVDMPSGSKTFNVTYSASGVASNAFAKALPTDWKMRIFLTGNAAERKLVVSTQRYLEQQKDSDYGKGVYRPDSSSFMIFNATADASVTDVEVKGATVDTTITFSSAVGAGKAESGFHAQGKTA